MKNSRLVKIFVSLCVLVFGLSIVFLIKQKEQIATLEKKNDQLIIELEKVEGEVKHFRIVNAILKSSSGGLEGISKETINHVDQVILFLQENSHSVESKFEECWERKWETTNWGSMGPYGLLDMCIDSIENSKAAILMKNIDSAAKVAESVCSADTDSDHDMVVNNNLNDFDSRYQKAKDCWADGNYRLLAGASLALFSAITTPDWISVQEPTVGVHNKKLTHGHYQLRVGW